MYRHCTWAPPITSFSLAPDMGLLATAHTQRRGIYLWANQTIFGSGSNAPKLTGETADARMPALTAGKPLGQMPKCCSMPGVIGAHRAMFGLRHGLQARAGADSAALSASRAHGKVCLLRVWHMPGHGDCQPGCFHHFVVSGGHLARLLSQS